MSKLDLELLKAYQDGDLDARDKFFENNKNLVSYVARKMGRIGIEYDDLYQAGCIALLESMKRFDFDKGVTFSTYAVHYIRGSLKNFMKDQTLIILGRSFHVEAAKWWKEKNRLRMLLFREPSDKEINLRLKWAKKTIRRILTHSRMLNDGGITRIDAPVEGYGHPLTLADVIPTKEKPMIQKMIADEENKQLYDAVAKLREKWQKVVVLRHGLDDNGTMNLREIGDGMKISRERVRQIENQSIKKLRRILWT